MVKIRCKQNGVRLHHTNPNIDIEFGTEPVEVEEKVADFLMKDKPDMFEIVDDKEEKRKKSSFNRLPKEE